MHIFKTASPCNNYIKCIRIGVNKNNFVTKCKITKVSTNYYTNYYLSNDDGSSKFTLYASNGATQYGAFDCFVDKVVTATFLLCDWNTKSYYAACLVSATDGENTVLNTYSFN